MWGMELWRKSDWFFEIMVIEREMSMGRKYPMAFFIIIVKEEIICLRI